MKTRHLATFCLSAVAAVTISACGEPKDKNNGINSLSFEEIKTLTSEAYIMSYPLIMNYATMYKQAIDPAAVEYTGGFGKFRHYGLATAANKDIVSPNNDTPYSWAWVDLRSEPWVVVMPEADGDRYYTSQWDDMWGFVLDSPGSVIDGQAGGAYLLATTDWDGVPPAGIKRVIRGESRFLGSITRTGTYGSDDLENVRKIQSGYKLMPLHEYTGEEAPTAAADIDWLPFVQGEEATIEAFKYVNFMLSYIIPHDMDKQSLSNMAKLGIEAGKSWDTSTFPKNTAEALEAGIAEAMAKLDAYKPQAKSGNLFNTRQVLKNDYTARMLGVVVGIFGNYASQATYLAIDTDADGDQINTAEASYKLTFPPGGTPPAKYFWSITMYSLPDRFLVDNSIDRYSIGSRSPQLEMNPDGSIDIYVSKDSPGPALENNWLPAPDGPPSLIMRVYGPEDAVLDGTYEMPRMVKTE